MLVYLDHCYYVQAHDVDSVRVEESEGAHFVVVYLVSDKNRIVSMTRSGGGLRFACADADAAKKRAEHLVKSINYALKGNVV